MATWMGVKDMEGQRNWLHRWGGGVKDMKGQRHWLYSWIVEYVLLPNNVVRNGQKTPMHEIL